MSGSARGDDGGTTPTGGRGRCPVCATGFTPAGRQIYCSTACRKRAFRARRWAAVAAVVPARAGRREHTVYECSDCGQRQAGEQWCHECVRPARALGLGAPCPHCGEPVTVAELNLAVGDRR